MIYLANTQCREAYHRRAWNLALSDALNGKDLRAKR